MVDNSGGIDAVEKLFGFLFLIMLIIMVLALRAPAAHCIEWGERTVEHPPRAHIFYYEPSWNETQIQCKEWSAGLIHVR